MKVYEEKIIPENKIKVCVARKCDLCGLEGMGDEWDAAYYKVAETEISVTIKAREGTAYPSGGSGVEYEIDLCPKCFGKELIPFLISKGANVEPQDWYY